MGSPHITDSHTDTNLFTDIYIYVCICTHTHTHTHTYIYIYIYIYILRKDSSALECTLCVFLVCDASWNQELSTTEIQQMLPLLYFPHSPHFFKCKQILTYNLLTLYYSYGEREKDRFFLFFFSFCRFGFESEILIK